MLLRPNHPVERSAPPRSRVPPDPAPRRCSRSEGPPCRPKAHGRSAFRPGARWRGIDRRLAGRRRRARRSRQAPVQRGGAPPAGSRRWRCCRWSAPRDRASHEPCDDRVRETDAEVVEVLVPPNVLERQDSDRARTGRGLGLHGCVGHASALHGITGRSRTESLFRIDPSASLVIKCRSIPRNIASIARTRAG